MLHNTQRIHLCLSHKEVFLIHTEVLHTEVFRIHILCLPHKEEFRMHRRRQQQILTFPCEESQVQWRKVSQSALAFSSVRDIKAVRHQLLTGSMNYSSWKDVWKEVLCTCVWRLTWENPKSDTFALKDPSIMTCALLRFPCTIGGVEECKNRMPCVFTFSNPVIPGNLHLTLLHSCNGLGGLAAVPITNTALPSYTHSLHGLFRVNVNLLPLPWHRELDPSAWTWTFNFS